MSRKRRITYISLDEASQIAVGVAAILDVLSVRVHDDPELKTAYLMVDRVATRLRQRAYAAAKAEVDGREQAEEPAAEVHTFPEGDLEAQADRA